jgi:ubiquitin carboxyl-terminal hydrolase L3
MHKIGLPVNWGVGECFGFDEDLLAFLPQPVIGIIVNIERLKKNEDKELGSEENNGKVNYYMKQSGTLDNACGIIACLHAALNKLD